MEPLTDAEIQIVRELAERNVRADRTTTLTELRAAVANHNQTAEQRRVPQSRPSGALGQAVRHYVEQRHQNLRFLTLSDRDRLPNNHLIYVFAAPDRQED